MWNQLDPEWIAAWLGLELWQIIVAPIAVIMTLSVLARLLAPQTDLTYRRETGGFRHSGPLPYVAGLAGGAVVALVLTGGWREVGFLLAGAG